MALYSNIDGKLSVIKSVPVASEKSIQTLVENNLLELLGVHFLATEYRTVDGTGRIDTLAVDAASGAPVIIEYKKKRDDNVITQVLSYLYWLKSQNYAFFEKLVAEKVSSELANKVKENWNYPRIICVAGQFSKNDINAVKVISSIRLELYVHTSYEGGLFSLNEEVIGTPKVPAVLTESTKLDTVKTLGYSIDDHINYGNEETRQLFLDLHDRILSLDENISDRPTSEYIGYRLTKTFAEVRIQKKKLKLFLRPINYLDPLNMITKISDSYGWVLDRQVYLNSRDELEYVMNLVEQSYQDVL